MMDWRALPDEERCPVCGQPDNCGDCDHTPMGDEAAGLMEEDGAPDHQWQVTEPRGAEPDSRDEHNPTL